jgi:protein-S-isoprenylcysteine O-methyltransferase Ste14
LNPNTKENAPPPAYIFFQATETCVLPPVSPSRARGFKNNGSLNYPMDLFAHNFILRRIMGTTSTTKKDIIPLIMWLALFAGIIVFSVIRLNRLFGSLNEYPVYLDIIFIGLYLLWMIIELKITRKDVNTEGKKTYDFMTCQLYGTGQALTILTALWFPSVWQMPNAVNFVGISVFSLGVLYRLWAIRTLGQFYSHHQIVASGPYKITRHPAYAGMIIANAGISVYFFNWVTLCVFFFILVPAIILRIIIEEKTLFGIQGYAEFAKKRKRLFPAVW